jgi:hypothetical protein
MRTLALPLLALLLVVPTVPTTLAHPGDVTGTYSVEADGLVVILKATSLVVKAKREEAFNGTILSNATGAYATVPDANVTIEAVGPSSEASVVTNRTPDGFQTRIVFPAAGEWDLYVRVDGALRRITMHVYPPSDAWLEATNLQGNFHYVGKPVRETLYFREDGTNQLLAPREPATGILERWVNETATPLGKVTLPRGDMSSVVFEHTFTEQGSYLLSLASESLQLPYGSLPPVLFQVQPPFRGDATAKESPSLSALALLAVVATLALTLQTHRR